MKLSVTQAKTVGLCDTPRRLAEIEAEMQIEHEKLKEKAHTTLGKSLRFLDDLPEGCPKKPIPFPYGSSEPRPYGWFSK